MAGDVSRGFVLRHMTDFDVPAVMELERTMFPEDAWSEDVMRAELEDPTRHYFVVCRGDGEGEGPVVAYAGLRAAAPYGNVQTIAVDRAWWGRGIATALVTRLLGEAYSRAVGEVDLEVRSDNARARGLYRRFGFTEVGIKRGYYIDGVDAIVMRCSAPAAAIARTGGGEPGEALEFGDGAEAAGEDEENV